MYYSRKGENYWNGSVKNLKKGNTEIVAEMIADMIGGDLFEVDTIKPYAADYYACIDEAKVELREKARPELKGYMDSLDGYDTIFVGYPNWWGTMLTSVISATLTSLQHGPHRRKMVFWFSRPKAGHARRWKNRYNGGE